MAQFYTLEEAARVLGMSPDDLKAQANKRDVRAFMDNGSWRFRVADIDEMARRRGMGSDPDLSLSDLDMIEQPNEGESASMSDFDLSEFQLGVATPEPGHQPTPIHSHGTDQDILLDDVNLPPDPLTNSSSTIIGMKPTGKQPSDSDVRLVPDNSFRHDASDSDVRLAPAEPRRSPGDSDVSLSDSGDEGSSDDLFPQIHKQDATAKSAPQLGSSGEMKAGGGLGDDSSDFELTPSSVIDALQPDSGSDFELSALDASDEFEATPLLKPSDSDVTGASPVDSGINLGNPSDSGINLLQSPGSIDLGRPDSIELAPLDLGDAPAPKSAAKPKKTQSKPDLSATAMPGKVDLSATALPAKADLSATALPMRSDKDIFEDTDFEVDTLEGNDSRTVQLEAASDFDMDDSDSASEVFSLDEDEVDENAATAMGPAVFDDAGSSDEISTSGSSGEVSNAWDVDAASAPSAASRASAPSPVLSSATASPEWGGLWVGFLMAATVFVMLLAFVAMDLVRNLHEYRGPTFVGSGLVKSISGMLPGGS